MHCCDRCKRTRLIAWIHQILPPKKAMFLLTKCAACAAPLETGIKRCSRCKTRYCSAACQREHWRRGDHKKKCEKIAW